MKPKQNRLIVIVATLALWLLFAIPLHLLGARIFVSDPNAVISVSERVSTTAMSILWAALLIGTVVGCVFQRTDARWPAVIYFLPAFAIMLVVTFNPPAIFASHGLGQPDIMDRSSHPLLFVGIQALRTVGTIALVGAALINFPGVNTKNDRNAS